MSGQVTDGPSPFRPELPVWRRIDLGRCSPLRAQTFVESVAQFVGAGEVPNTLLFARPDSPYVSLGFHQSFAEEVDPQFVARRRIPVIRRVEGGGTTWLDSDQWFYQLVYRDEGAGGPGDLARLLRPVAEAATEQGLTLTVRPPSDLVVGERKISGNAGGDWDGAHILVGGILGRADRENMADLLRLPHPGVRPIVRAELARWVTSWVDETGHLPEWTAFADAVTNAFGEAGLFRTRSADPSEAEEAHFRRETVARHQETTWSELPPLPRTASSVERRLRVAGPHGILVLAGPGSEERRIAIVDGAVVRAGYALGPSLEAVARPLPRESSELEELAAAVRSITGFD